MTRKKTIGFGIVGTGMIANYHAKAISALSATHDIRLVGALDSAPGRARDFANKNDVPFHTDSAEVFFANPDIDVVCITTPSGAHLEPALQAIGAGKQLIVEKPLEITVERVDALLDAARQANVKVAAIFQARLSRGARVLKEALDAGRFGRLSLCSAYIKWHRSAAYYSGWKGTLKIDGGGALINQAIHAIDLLQWLAGMPQEIFAFKTRRVHLGIEAEDTACAALRFGSGALGTIEATTAAYPGWERRIEICGEFGSAAIEDERIVRWDFRDATPADAELLASPDNASSGSGAGAPDQIDFSGHQRQIEDMVRSLRNGTPLLIDGVQARNTVVLVRALYQSAESGLPVMLEV
ncbi:MAG: oxidoreductase domain protein [Proteobacteria bacterium]|nr:oxidoreductase domain protein [Pseudomonadota bacterium]